jgi:hypothetical protein
MNATFIKPQWSPLTIALMVLGFVIFWPLGLAMLAYILWGEMFGGSPEKAEAWVNKSKAWCQSNNYRHNGHGNWRQSSGNAAFDEYRAEQLKRLDEERKRLDEDYQKFQDHLRNLRMARDREEFDRFMRDRNSNDNSSNYGSGQSV